MTSGALSEAWGFVKGPKRVPDADDPGRRPGADRLASPPARPRAAHGRLRPRGDPDQPGEHRQGIRHRPGGRADPRPTGGRRRPWSTAAGRACTRSGSPPGRFGGRWEVALRNPFRAGIAAGRLRLRNRALGTSGAAFQQFVVDGRVYGHIIDPRSGEPALGPASVTVLAPDRGRGRRPVDGLLSARARGRRGLHAPPIPRSAPCSSSEGPVDRLSSPA